MIKITKLVIEDNRLLVNASIREDVSGVSIKSIVIKDQDYKVLYEDTDLSGTVYIGSFTSMDLNYVDLNHNLFIITFDIS